MMVMMICREKEDIEEGEKLDPLKKVGKRKALK
jgi:hypothetical protein